MQQVWWVFEAVWFQQLAILAAAWTLTHIAPL